METIFIMDDEEELCKTLSRVLSADYEVSWETTVAQALQQIRKKSPACILLDLKLAKTDPDGLEVLNQLKQIDSRVPVIMLTAYETVKTAVQAMKQGAFHYMPKPFNNEELKALIRKAIDKRQMALRVSELRTGLGKAEDLEAVMGSSEKIQAVIKLVQSVAETDLNVLLLGESGTGKELVARLIHNRSRRCSGPFITVDCASIPETLMESELFGHGKGAFTGAGSSQKGYFEEADGGTIFLDEVGNIPFPIQAKLLRFLESREIQRVGNHRPVRVSVRIIAATNADLLQQIETKLFRPDLFYRLNEFPISLPPLRERKEDIPLLCKIFMAGCKQETGKEIIDISQAALQKLESHSFPGNGRELKNIIKRAMVFAFETIEISDLPKEVVFPKKTAAEEIHVPVVDGLSLPEAARRASLEIEKRLIRNALKQAKWCRGEAAQFLGVSPKTLYNKMKEYGIYEGGGER